MGGVRIPIPLKNVAHQIEAKKWVEDKKFDRDRWYTGVDEMISAWRHVLNDDLYEPSNEEIVTALARMVLESEELESQVEKINQVPTESDAWMQMCLAASWVIIQSYRNAIRKKEWPRDAKI